MTRRTFLTATGAAAAASSLNAAAGPGVEAKAGTVRDHLWLFTVPANTDLKPEALERPATKEAVPEAAPTEFNVVLHGESFHIKVTGTGHKEQAERHFYLTVDGVPEEVVVQTLDQVVLTGGAQGAVKATIGGKRPKATKEGHVSTSMPGNIVAVLVKEGDMVTAGQPVLVTEAMKMEAEIQAPVAATVTAIHVKKGDRVTPGEVLIEITP